MKEKLTHSPKQANLVKNFIRLKGKELNLTTGNELLNDAEIDQSGEFKGGITETVVIHDKLSDTLKLGYYIKSRDRWYWLNNQPFDQQININNNYRFIELNKYNKLIIF